MGTNIEASLPIPIDNPFKPTRNFIKVITPFMDSKKSVRYPGYEVCKMTGLRSGIVYPLLHELNQKSCLSSEWNEVEENSTGPRKKLYQITPSGLKSGRKLIDTEFPFLKEAMSAIECK